METTDSVSKGVFLFRNGVKLAKGSNKPEKESSFLDKSTTEAMWYQSYKKNWNHIETMIAKIQTTSYAKIMDDLLYFIENCYYQYEYEGVLPTAALLTGINQIDHLSQLEKMVDNIRNNTFSSVVLLKSRYAANLKQAIETIVEGFIEERTFECSEERLLRKNQLNLIVLKAWYEEKYDLLERKPNLTIIMPDFELLSSTLLEDLILILNAYASSLPFVLIFGVATSINTIHSFLPYHVTSKIKLSIFQSEPSITHLNKILDNVILTPYCPFHLSGKAMKLLMDIFLFYDFSVKGFVSGFKYAVMQHYFQSSIHALATTVSDEEELHEMVNELSASDLEEIRQLSSFRPFVESLQTPQEVIGFLTDDQLLRQSLPGMLIEVHNFWFMFHCALCVLQELVSDLPKAPLGKHFREFYCLCVSSDVTELPEFKECMQLMSFLSKAELLVKLRNVLEIVFTYVNRSDQLSMEGCFLYNVAPLEKMSNGLATLSDELAAANQEQIYDDLQHDQNHQYLLSPGMGRQELREKLLTAARHSKSQSESGVTRVVGRLVDFFVENIFQRYLRPPYSRSVPLVELFLFEDSNAIRSHIVGAPRAAIHTALKNPQHYTKCKCCILKDENSIVPTLPDISIAYKLHLECGRMINLFDWLQAFRMVVEDSDEEGQENNINPRTLARFTRAVADLQFLGFIKASKKKTDHVARLTW